MKFGTVLVSNILHKIFRTEQIILRSINSVLIHVQILLYVDLYELYRLNCNSLLVM